MELTNLSLSDLKILHTGLLARTEYIWSSIKKGKIEFKDQHEAAKSALLVVDKEIGKRFDEFINKYK